MKAPTDSNRPHLYSIELKTSRWDEMVRWYRDVLGLRSLIRQVEDGFSQMHAGSASLVILARVGAPPPSHRYTLVMEMEDLDELAGRLTEAKWKFDPPAKTEEGYWQIVTADPDGNRVLIFAW